jgi:hypothetical protein
MVLPPFIQLSLLIVACYALSFQIMHRLAYLSSTYFLLRLFLFPGVILHESSHALACLLTATPIEHISFWDEAGGHVTHHKPKLAFIIQPFISFAPFPVGIMSLLFLGNKIPSATWLVAALLVSLMVSIAATLAPSKTDMIHAIEGSIVLFAIGIATYYFFPGIITHIEPAIEKLARQMQLVTLLLLICWLVLIGLHSVTLRFRR